jgi:UPF0755 protein
LNKSRPTFFAGRIVFVSVGLLILIAAGGVAASLILASNLDRPTGTLGEEGLLFSVGQGDSGTSVARRLYREGAIRSELLLRLMMKAGRMERDLKVGEYRILPAMRSSEILDMIVEGRQMLIRLVIPEGSTVRAVAKAAESAGIATEDEVMGKAYDAAFVKELGLDGSSVAGYLFPDTYLLPKNSGAEDLIRLMVDTFRQRLLETIPESAGIS